jgi:hypothetical protein
MAAFWIRTNMSAIRADPKMITIINLITPFFNTFFYN